MSDNDGPFLCLTLDDHSLDEESELEKMAEVVDYELGFDIVSEETIHINSKCRRSPLIFTQSSKPNPTISTSSQQDTLLLGKKEVASVLIWESFNGKIEKMDTSQPDSETDIFDDISQDIKPILYNKEELTLEESSSEANLWTSHSPSDVKSDQTNENKRNVNMSAIVNEASFPVIQEGLNPSTVEEKAEEHCFDNEASFPVILEDLDPSTVNDKAEKHCLVNEASFPAIHEGLDSSTVNDKTEEHCLENEAMIQEGLDSSTVNDKAKEHCFENEASFPVIQEGLDSSTVNDKAKEHYLDNEASFPVIQESLDPSTGNDKAKEHYLDNEASFPAIQKGSDPFTVNEKAEEHCFENEASFPVIQEGLDPFTINDKAKDNCFENEASFPMIQEGSPALEPSVLNDSAENNCFENEPSFPVIQEGSLALFSPCQSISEIRGTSTRAHRPLHSDVRNAKDDKCEKKELIQDKSCSNSTTKEDDPFPDLQDNIFLSADESVFLLAEDKGKNSIDVVENTIWTPDTFNSNVDPICPSLVKSCDKESNSNEDKGMKNSIIQECDSISAETIVKSQSAAMDKAQPMLEELPSFPTHGPKVAMPSKDPGFVNLRTKKDFDISSSALEKAKNMLKEEGLPNLRQNDSKTTSPHCDIPSKSPGFVSLRTKKGFDISSSALEKAKKMFQDEELYQNKPKAASPHCDTSTKSPGFINLRSKNSCTISSSALEKAKKMFQDEELYQNKPKAVSPHCDTPTKSPGFINLRSKKSCTISSSALEKAEKMFQDEELYQNRPKVASPHCDTSTKSPGFINLGSKKVFSISSSALEKAKNMFQEEEFPNLRPNDSKHCDISANGFINLRSKKSCTISSSALEKAEKMFKGEELPNLQTKDSKVSDTYVPLKSPGFINPRSTKGNSSSLEKTKGEELFKLSNNNQPMKRPFIKSPAFVKPKSSSRALNPSRSKEHTHKRGHHGDLINCATDSKLIKIVEGGISAVGNVPPKVIKEDTLFSHVDYSSQFLEEVEEAEKDYLKRGEESLLSLRRKAVHRRVPLRALRAAVVEHSSGMMTLEQVVFVGAERSFVEGIPLVPNGNGEIRYLEIKQAFLSLPGVDPSQASEAWIANHYRWIVTYLYSLRREEDVFTPRSILRRLKYRYDREIAGSSRSALKKIYEGDESPSRALILFVASIGTESLELSDGWYSISAPLKLSLAKLVLMERIVQGSKLYIEGGEVERPPGHGACKPLEDRGRTKFLFSVNSSRRARWWSKLGFHWGPTRLVVRLDSIKGDGGLVSAVKVILQRRYPLIYMVKNSNGGGTSYLNEKAHAKRIQSQARSQEEFAEKIFAQVQKEFEEKKLLSQRGKIVDRRSLKELRQICSGEELFNLLESCQDPSLLEALNPSQVEELQAFRRQESDRLRCELRREVEARVKASNGCRPFEVVPILRLKISDESPDVFATLSVWRPSSEIISSLQEGKSFNISRLSVSPSSSANEVFLSSIKSTVFNSIHGGPPPIQRRERTLSSVKEIILKEYDFGRNFNEADLVCVVLQVTNSNSQLMTYGTDLLGNFVRLSAWSPLSDLALESVILPSRVLYFRNLKMRRGSTKEIPTLLLCETTEVLSSYPKDLVVSSVLEDFHKGLSLKSIGDSLDLLQLLLSQEPSHSKMDISEPILCHPPSKMEILPHSPAAAQSSRNKAKLSQLERLSYPDAAPLFPLHPLPKRQLSESQEFDAAANRLMDSLGQ